MNRKVFVAAEAAGIGKGRLACCNGRGRRAARILLTAKAVADPSGNYRIDEADLAVGATLGGPRLAIKLLRNGAIWCVHSARTGLNLFSRVDVHFWDAKSGLRLGSHVGSVLFRPESQSNTYTLGDGSITVERTVFASTGVESQPESAYMTICIRNNGPRAITLATVVAARIKGSFIDEIEAEWNERLHTFIIRSTCGAANSRSLTFSVPPDSWAVSGDQAWVTLDRFHGNFDKGMNCQSFDPLALANFERCIEPGSSAEWFVTMSGFVEEDRKTTDFPQKILDAKSALQITAEWYERRLKRAVMLSPVIEIDVGVRWAKINMLRVMRHAPTGLGFTNDPTRSSACVARDSAWFVHGCDWVAPEFSAGLLQAFSSRQEANGKIVEFYNLQTGEVSDDGLNVNDDTPLFILAVWHHAVSTGDRKALEELYEYARRAADQLLAQRDGRGLVFCSATDRGSRGMISWRNIIPKYWLSGVSTEVNSETVAALEKLIVLARMLNRSADVQRFEKEVRQLRAAIEQHLRNPENGLYYLGIDVNGQIRSELTADLVFPVIFGVADNATCEKIIERLREADFWTAGGVRTVPRTSPQYHPTEANGLLGGVWVGVTFWYAFGAARFVPEIMVEALQQSFEHLARDPLTNSTVPGEFPEWLNGESLVNEGMTLSPWFAPRYLWAAVEGAGGLESLENGIRIAPRIPSSWSWMAVRNVTVQGKMTSWFFVREDVGRLFVTRDVESKYPVDVYERDVTDELEVAIEGDELAVVAFARGQEILVLLGNRGEHTTTAAVRREGILAEYSERRRYDSLQLGWRSDAGSALVRIPRYHFTIIEFVASPK